PMLSSRLQVFIAVDRHNDGDRIPRLLVGMVAALRSDQNPAVFLQNATHALAGDHFHNSISWSSALAASAFACVTADSAVTSSQSSAASRMLASASSRVSPCEWQPGIPGTLTEYPPTASRRRSTFSFMILPHCSVRAGRGSFYGFRRVQIPRQKAM